MVLDDLTEIIKKIAPNSKTDNLSGSSRLKEDLGLDSLSSLMMAMQIEEKYKFKFEKMAMFTTVQEVIDYLASIGIKD